MSRTSPRWRLGLRFKLALLALVLLALPWVGLQYVQEMERLLLEAQRQTLADTARAVATALHGRPQLMRLSPPRDSELRRAAEEDLQRLVAESGGGAPVDGAFVGPPAPWNLPPLPEAVPLPADPLPAMDEAAATAEISAILRALERNPVRIWVVNRELRVLAMSGSLAPASTGEGEQRWWQPLLRGLIKTPPADFDQAIDEEALAAGREVANALLGVPGSRVRSAGDARAMIVSAAQPIWDGDRVVGAVAVEETTHSILSLRNRALERLLLATLAVFLLGAVALLWFASRLSGRIRRLRDAAEGAVDARGRIAGPLPGSRAGDEIGDLARSFATLMERLAQHHGYLETMASRLSHELRTPVTVVRSSLENLRQQALPGEAQVYMDRAEHGLQRLAKILSRMSEATRLEQSLEQTERERFDLVRLARECVEGYRLAYPQQRFAFSADRPEAWVTGAPDLLAQMLDKLAANAADFAQGPEPIRIALESAGERVQLLVVNLGPALPESMRGRLFESMVSVRGRSEDSEPHLGLGLYVARLIAEFHRGTIRADNLPGGGGVCVTVELPLG